MSATDSTGRFRTDKTVSVDEQMEAVRLRVVNRDPEQKEFHQTFEEVLKSLKPVFEKNLKYLGVLESMAEPEKVHTFRVAWQDDKGIQQVNRGFRVQFNSAIGPYKGGLRFHPSVNLSVIKFLGFEQIFKNSLTTLPIGGGKGGSDFDPKGKSDGEVMRFCQSFMTQLYRYIGANEDVPAGDIGVGGREIGYLFGQYKRITSQFEGVLTGKNPKWGGSLIRPEATGYGCVYFADEILRDRGTPMKGKRVAVSGSGNVAQYTVEKLLHLGAIPVTLSDSAGYIYVENGIDTELLQKVMYLKNEARGRLSELEHPGVVYHADKKPWEVKCDLALPSATQNEINLEEAQTLVANGCIGIVEGANMPCTNEAAEFMIEKGLIFGPAKAANAGGVAVSALEMSQNSQRLHWTSEQVDEKLRSIMHNIFHESKSKSDEFGLSGNLLAGANIAGFLKVADSMIEQGCL